MEKINCVRRENEINMEKIILILRSFEKIIANGTVSSILKNILAIIENIANGLSNAWKNNENGSAIIQNLANAFNDLLVSINNTVKSEKTQEFLNRLLNKIRDITERLTLIDLEISTNDLLRTAILVAIIVSISLVALEIIN